jgi:hypothetical protein
MNLVHVWTHRERNAVPLFARTIPIQIRKVPRASRHELGFWKLLSRHGKVFCEGYVVRNHK